MRFLKKICPSVFKKAARSLEIARFCHKVYPFWRPGYLKVYLRALQICRQRRFEPYEAYRLGLFQPAFEDKNLDNYTSRKITTKLEKAVNPESWELLLKDKGVFYRQLMAYGLPMPQLYAIFFQKVPGWSPYGVVLAGRDDWQRFIAAIEAREFVIKPCKSAFGKGIRIFTKESGAFRDTAGNTLKASDIYDLMRADKGFDSFVIQQRLYNHHEFCRMNPSDFLQTVRVTTFIDRKGQCHILFAFFKLIGSSNITDNFGDGLNGNMISIVNTRLGTLGPGFVTAAQGKGTTCFDKHPQTGVEFSSFAIPRWSEVIALAKQAAAHFMPIRSIGWDIVITPQDIKILEGNIWWNPLNRTRWKDIIENELPYEF
jgi:hypothetical protein